MELVRELQVWFDREWRLHTRRSGVSHRPAFERLADEDVLEATVGALAPAEGHLLRMLCRTRSSHRPLDWDEVCRQLFGEPGSQALLRTGLAFRGEEQHGAPALIVPEPLRLRLLALCPAESFPQFDAPPPAEGWDERAETFRFGLVLAAVERLRPRTSGYVDMHRTDRRALVELLTPAFENEGAAEAALDLALRRDWLRTVAGRFAVDFESLDAADDVGARLAYERIRGVQPNEPFAVLLARLRDGRWHPLPHLLEDAACAYLAQAHSGSAARLVDEARVLASGWPGLGTREVHGTTYVCLSPLGRRVFGLETELPAHDRSLLVQPNLELVAQPGLDPRLVARLGRIARLVSLGGAIVMRLDEEAVRRAAGEGLEPSAMSEMLASGTRHALPATVTRTLSDWAGVKGNARLLTGTVLLTEAPGAAVRKALKGIELKEIAGGVWLLSSRKADAATRALRGAGLRCEVVGAETDDAEGVVGTRSRRSWREEAEELITRGRRELSRLPQ